MFLVFILSLIGSGDFSGERLIFWILLGSIITHSAPIFVLQKLLNCFSLIRSKRLPRRKKRSRDPIDPERDNNSPEDFWGSVESLSDTPTDTEPMSNEFWDTVEFNTKKTDKESDEANLET